MSQEARQEHAKGTRRTSPLTRRQATALIAVAVASLVVGLVWDALFGKIIPLRPEGIRDWLDGLGAWAPLVFVALMTAAVVVSPIPSVPLDIAARVRGADSDQPNAVETVRGQVEVATTEGLVESVELVPADPPACPEALEAVRAADWVILGPGSWYTSVLPHLLVPELRAALSTASARRCVTLNLAPQQGETDGFTSSTYLEVLAVHAPDLNIDVVLADAAGVVDMAMLEETIDGLGADLVIEDLAATDGSPRHDVAKLATAYAGIMQ